MRPVPTPCHPSVALPGRPPQTRSETPPSTVFHTLCQAVWLSVAGCSPALDWRDVAWPDSGVTIQMPCKPKAHARELPVAGLTTKVTVVACQAQNMTFALSWADVGDPVRVGPALQEWRDAAKSNLGAQAQPVSAKPIPGATPHDQAGRWALAGRSPQGEARQSEVVLAVRGTRVVQVTMLGAAWDTEAADNFLGSLRFQSGSS